MKNIAVQKNKSNFLMPRKQRGTFWKNFTCKPKFHKWFLLDVCILHLKLIIVNKLFVFKSFLTMPSNVLPLHYKETFPPIIWIFTAGEGDGMKSRLPSKIFSTLQRKYNKKITDEKYPWIWLWKVSLNLMGTFKAM